jgi:hypothetical protein
MVTFFPAQSVKGTCTLNHWSEVLLIASFLITVPVAAVR